MMGILSVLFGEANANKARRARDEQFAAQSRKYETDQLRAFRDRYKDDPTMNPTVIFSAKHPEGVDVCPCCGRA